MTRSAADSSDLLYENVGELPLALPGAFQGDPAARWYGSNTVLRGAQRAPSMAALSTVGRNGARARALSTVGRSH